MKIKIRLYEPLDKDAFNKELSEFLVKEAAKAKKSNTKAYYSNVKDIKLMAKFIISFIASAKQYNKDKELSSVLLREISHQMDRAKKFLVTYGYVKITKKFIISRRCNHYSLNMEKFSPKLVFRSLKHDKYTKRFHDIFLAELPDGGKEHIDKPLSKLKLDAEKAKEYVAACKSEGLDTDVLESMESTISAFEDTPYHKIDGFSGRSHTPATNCKSDMREYLYFDGHEDDNIASLDISNSQFVISTALFTPKGMQMLLDAGSDRKIYEMVYNLRNSTDIKQYIELAREGTLYDFIHEEAQKSKYRLVRNLFASRAHAKSVMFHFNFAPKQPRKWMGVKKWAKWKTIQNLFPNLYTIIEAMRDLNVPKFYPKLLQMMEVAAVIDGAAKKLYDNGLRHYATIHDSLILPSKYKHLAQNAIKESFVGLFGFEPSIRADIYEKRLHLETYKEGKGKKYRCKTY